MTKPTDDLENEYVDNKKKIESLHARNADIVSQLIKEFHGISKGDVVICKGHEYKITRTELVGNWDVYQRTHKPWVYGNTLLKNGTWGTKDVLLYGVWVKKE